MVRCTRCSGEGATFTHVKVRVAVSTEITDVWCEPMLPNGILKLVWDDLEPELATSPSETSQRSAQWWVVQRGAVRVTAATYRPRRGGASEVAYFVGERAIISAHEATSTPLELADEHKYKIMALIILVLVGLILSKFL